MRPFSHWWQRLFVVWLGTSVVAGIVVAVLMVMAIRGPKPFCFDPGECTSIVAVTNDLGLPVEIEDCFEADCPPKGWLERNPHGPFRMRPRETASVFAYGGGIDETMLRIKVDGQHRLRCIHTTWHVPKAAPFNLKLPPIRLSRAVSCTVTSRTGPF